MKLNRAAQVVAAQKARQPVVAMESTVYSSLGLPQPANAQAYERACQAVGAAKAVGAVTAVVDGQVRVGLSKAEMGRLLDASQPVRKVSLGDLAVATAQGWELGATTVSASLAVAHQAGIKVFATGGIGGVHRENPNDVSADLLALARYPLATVCSGAKAFLDLPATLERLETLGVAVVGYATDQFPAFWSRESGIAVSHRVDSADEAADIIAQLAASGVLFVVPPPEEAALAWVEVEAAAEQALGEAASQEVRGGAVTPFVLERISQLTDGKTLDANVALVANNAGVAAEIAASLCLRRR